MLSPMLGLRSLRLAGEGSGVQSDSGAVSEQRAGAEAFQGCLGNV